METTILILLLIIAIAIITWCIVKSHNQTLGRRSGSVVIIIATILIIVLHTLFFTVKEQAVDVPGYFDALVMATMFILLGSAVINMYILFATKNPY